MSDAMKKHPDADVLINFASLRSAYESTMETLTYPQVDYLKPIFSPSDFEMPILISCVCRFDASRS